MDDKEIIVSNLETNISRVLKGLEKVREETSKENRKYVVALLKSIRNIKIEKTDVSSVTKILEKVVNGLDKLQKKEITFDNGAKEITCAISKIYDAICRIKIPVTDFSKVESKLDLVRQSISSLGNNALSLIIWQNYSGFQYWDSQGDINLYGVNLTLPLGAIYWRMSGATDWRNVCAYFPHGQPFFTNARASKLYRFTATIVNVTGLAWYTSLIDAKDLVVYSNGVVFVIGYNNTAIKAKNVIMKTTSALQVQHAANPAFFKFVDCNFDETKHYNGTAISTNFTGNFRKFTLRVIDEFGNPIQGATVGIKDIYGHNLALVDTGQLIKNNDLTGAATFIDCQNGAAFSVGDVLQAFNSFLLITSKSSNRLFVNRNHYSTGESGWAIDSDTIYKVLAAWTTNANGYISDGPSGSQLTPEMPISLYQSNGSVGYQQFTKKYLNPFTVTISKAGYETLLYKLTIPEVAYAKNDIMDTAPISLEIVLKKSKTFMLTIGGKVKLLSAPSQGSSSKLIDT